MKVIFMGTPQFAVEIVNEINKIHDVILVVTQPDTYNNKKKEMIFSPVKIWAIEHNINVFQPEKIRIDNQKIMDLDCDIIVTAAYGQFISDEVLNHPRLRSINVHGSILPKYRGGAPIQRAIINGETETGITIMYMEKKMDAGDILRIERLPILDDDNQETLFYKLSKLGASVINEFLADLDEEKIKPIKQNEDEATFAYNLTKDDELIDFTKDARSVFNQIRGLNSNPGAYFILDNLPVKVYNSIVSDKVYDVKPKVIVSVNKTSFDISCANGTAITILEVQLPSKNKVPARDFINGQGRKMLVINKEIK